MKFSIRQLFALSTFVALIFGVLSVGLYAKSKIRRLNVEVQALRKRNDDFRLEIERERELVQPTQRTNVVTVEYLLPINGGAIGPGPTVGDRVQLYRDENGINETVVEDVRVFRIYNFDRKVYPAAEFVFGLELTDEETMEYLRAKQAGRVEIRIL